MNKLIALIMVAIIFASCDSERTLENELSSVTIVKPNENIEEVTDDQSLGLEVTEEREDTIDAIDIDTVNSHSDEVKDIEYKSEFSVYRDDLFIPIQAWDDEIDIESIAGDEINHEIILLDQGSDTFSGSFVKVVEYNHLVLEMFSPKDNGETFWIKRMTVNGASYSTKRGIKVGDSLDLLLGLYPELENYEDNIYWYYGIDDEYTYIKFQVDNSVIISYEIIYEMP